MSLPTITPTEYCTVLHLRWGTDPDFLVAVSDDDSDNKPDNGVMQYAVDSANGIVDGYVAITPGLPVVELHMSLRYIAIKIAIFILASRRRIVDELVKQDFEWAITQLIAMKDGNFNIEIPGAGGLSAAASVVEANKDEEDRDASNWSETKLKSRFPRRGFGGAWPTDPEER
jgi:phage gp36-like protein